MSFSDIVERIKGVRGVTEVVTSRSALFITATADALKPLAMEIYQIMGGFFRTCIGSDERSINNCFAIYYIFGLDDRGLNIVVKVYADSKKPELPSISDIVPASDWCEMEARDLFGIEFTGRASYRLILPHGWPNGVHPLRKDYSYDSRPVTRAVSERLTLVDTISTVPIGPYHPALHEPEYFELYIEGERVIDVKYRGFHVHRGIEKLGESKLTYQQVNFIAERICGICGFEHSTCYAQVVESAAGIEVPERAKFIRSIVLEIERIHSHLLWVGVVAHLLGYDAGFMHTWRIREHVMTLAELLTGSRKMYGLNLIGGVRRDIDLSKKEKILEVLDTISKEYIELASLMVSIPQVRMRLKGSGVLYKEDARKLSVVGPVARASGLRRDVRKDLPYAAYRYASFNVPVYDDGDNFSRLMVRLDEIKESISIVKQLLDQMPPGPIKVEEFIVPEGVVAISAVEAPRGEDVHFIITGHGRPFRWRVRAPTYQNIPALKHMLKDQPLADAPLTIASIDPCFSCTDRVLVIDSSGSKRTLKLGWGLG
ncbi:MAG: NADH-quinone oxidoreductase subunit C [Desulfurococcaceae archaeon]|nr:NADH-quinone oxidoreductase subunit C [Sulfolobales archaeon]MDW8169677.1 NADH-quinone oxidoreductase subunit C [Desulfurococcaceae archaeon]